MTFANSVEAVFQVFYSNPICVLHTEMLRKLNIISLSLTQDKFRPIETIVLVLKGNSVHFFLMQVLFVFVDVSQNLEPTLF